MIYPKLSDGTIDWCAMCKRMGSDINDLCCMCSYVNEDDPPSRYEPIVKPMTNADRIRSMSDEELASKLASFRCPFDGCFPEGGGNCKKCWLDWLREEEHNEIY